MKILYIMNVDWKWIKQRPHFVAEGLAKKHEIMLYYPYSYHRNKDMFCENHAEIIQPHKYYNLPFRRRYKLVNIMNNWYLYCFFTFIVSIKHPDVIWLGGDPDVACYLSKKNLGKVVYDCMDDYYAMSKNNEVMEKEKKIVNNCRHIFVSSLNLKNKVIERYRLDKRKVTLVRNGYDGKIIDNFGRDKLREEYIIAYIGTVSSWFDFELIEFIVNKVDNVQFHIIGPIKSTVIEQCKKLGKMGVVFYGSMEHDLLYDFVSNVDCLIMPFIISEVTLSVDPVKLYEYINFNKNIISIKYPEIERFSGFVNFYSTRDEAVNVIIKLKKNKKITYVNDERLKFLNNNSWDDRIKNMLDVLKSEF